MRFALLIPLLSLGAFGHGLRLQSKNDGLDQVITLLLKMMSDFRSQTTADKDAWEGYSSWSEESESDKNGYMQEQQALEMSQTALMSANQQEAQKLTAEIAKLQGDIAATVKSVDELTLLRRQEHSQHEAELADLTKTIDAVNKAIEILEGHYAASQATLAEIKQRVQYAMSLTGVNAGALVQKGPDWLSTDGSKYNKFDGQSGAAGGVIGTLNDLRSTLDQNKQESIEKENDQRRVYEDTKGAKDAELSRMRGEMAAKTLKKSEAESTITSCRATINEASKNQADAQAYINLLQADRTKNQEEFNGRSQMRNDEMAATQAALDALQAVSAGAKSGVGLLQGSHKKTGLVQKGTEPKCKKCRSEAQKLVALAKKLKSDALLEVATDLNQRANGFYDATGFEPVKELP